MNPINILFGSVMLLLGLTFLFFPGAIVRIMPSGRLRHLLDDDGKPSLTVIRVFSFFPILAGLVIAHKGLTSPLR